jgi:hypothetical protein
MEPRISGDYAIQPSVSAAEQAHPRYAEYHQYRTKLASQLVRADTFLRWLEQVEREENGYELVYEVSDPRAKLALGWYKNVFRPNSKGRPYVHGPFATREEAEKY